MGTPLFAVPPLLTLINDPVFDVTATVTQEDKKAGRKQILTPPPVKTAAVEHGIPVLQPPVIKGNNEFSDLLSELKADFFVVAAYGSILPSKILNIPRFGCINIHASLLPNYRGASPVEEALLRGDRETGVSFIKMTPELDAGPVYSIFRLPILDTDTSQTLRDKLSVLAANQLPYLLKDIISGDQPPPIEQDASKASYCRKIAKEDGQADLNIKTAREVFNMIRAYDPWPGCHLVLNDKKLRVLEADTDSVSAQALKAKPYELVELDKNKIGIGTKKGLLIPLKIQFEGKKAMNIQEFLLGNRTLLAKLLDNARKIKNKACP